MARPEIGPLWANVEPVFSESPPKTGMCLCEAHNGDFRGLPGAVSFGSRPIWIASWNGTRIEPCSISRPGRPARRRN